MERNLITIAFLLTLTACSLLSRHPNSGYSEAYGVSPAETERFYGDRKMYEIEQARESLRLDPSRIITDEERQALAVRLELNRLEKDLQSRREKKQYYHYKPLLKNDLLRVQFLRLPTLEARERWVKAKDVLTDPENVPDDIAEVIEEKDITTGMTKYAVQQSWGDPDMVEVAGNPMYGNERWKYVKMISSESGYDREMRVIYFESGKVVGWEKY